MNKPANSGISTAPRVRIVLVGTTHPGNIGAAARAMKTMALDELVLVGPRHFPHAEATARASGADDVLARARVVESLSEGVADCSFVLGTSARARHLDWPRFDAREFALSGQVQQATGAVAVVFGRENSGLSNDELDLCQAMLQLPTNPAFSSLNLASAVQLVAYELRMADLAATVTASLAPGPDGEPMSGDVLHREMEGFFEHQEQVLEAIGYFDPRTPKLLRRRLRRMFNKMAPDRSELNILRGIYSAMQRLCNRR
jgi:tRNA (cytidine32/uridine32-2'-O)-methyltransferase